MNKIFSNGKLLLTAEYLVLDGALALAVPTKTGQTLVFEEISDGKSLIFWQAKHLEKAWLSAKIDYENWKILETNLPESAEFILKVFKNLKELNSEKLSGKTSYFFETNLEFPADFGFGSSSTLMNNLAQWGGVDAFSLNEISLGGSGYDVAVAKTKSAILYQVFQGKKTIKKVDFRPKFSKELLLVHLNKKQDTRQGIKLYREKRKSQKNIDFFTDITKQVLSCESLSGFSDLMSLHEARLGKLLGMETAKEKYFPDIPAFVKSLGAWGGDFVLTQKFPDYENYFFSKDFPVFFDFSQMLL